MSKVKKEIVEAAILKFIDKIAETMPNSTYKFILGGTAALVTLKQGKILDNLLQNVSDADGYVETEKARQVIDSGFKVSDGKIQIDLFNDKSSLMSLFVRPLTLTITKNDIDEIFKEIESNSVQNVTLSQT